MNILNKKIKKAVYKSFSFLLISSVALSTSFVYLPPTQKIYAQSAFIVDCAANPSTIREGETTTWTAFANGGTAPYTYKWSTGGNSATEKARYNDDGRFIRRVDAKDATGATVETECSVQVVDGQAPGTPSTNTSSGSSSNNNNNQGTSIPQNNNFGGGSSSSGSKRYC